MSNIGRKLYELRKESRLTQKELAKMVDVSPKAISLYENGERTPSRDVLCRFSNKFYVSVDYLLDNSCERRLKSSLAREKFGFFIPRDEREKMKDVFERECKKNLSIEKRVELCTEDLKQYFSRSVEQNGYNLKHVGFPEFAAMLLNQKNFEQRYGEAYPLLCALYPPKPGISPGCSTYRVHEPQADTLDDNLLEILDILRDKPAQDLEIVKQFILWLADVRRRG